jgi:hypothetical protein
LLDELQKDTNGLTASLEQALKEEEASNNTFYPAVRQEIDEVCCSIR